MPAASVGVKTAAVDAADDDEEQDQHAPHLAQRGQALVPGHSLAGRAGLGVEAHGHRTAAR
jgi:hypothetical protein